MREIKFRAWDDVEKRMIQENCMIHFYDYEVRFYDQSKETYRVYPFSDVVLMQFTSLHDKNGKEIYEGDVVEVEGGAGVIVWDEHDLAWDLRGADMPITRSVEPKIIGNIYENPDLLSTNTKGQ